MLMYPRRNSTSTSQDAATITPTREEVCARARHGAPQRNFHHYAFSYLLTALLLVNHHVFAQLPNSDGSPSNSAGQTSDEPNDDRMTGGGDGIRNGRWGGDRNGGGWRRRRRLSKAAVVGICIGVVILVVDIMILFIWLYRRKLRKAQEQARESLAQEQQANIMNGSDGIKVDTSNALAQASPSTSSPHPLLPFGGCDGNGGNLPNRRSYSFQQRLSRYGSTKWKEFRLLGSRDKPTPPPPRFRTRSGTLPLYTPPTFDNDSVGDDDQGQDSHPMRSSSTSIALSDPPPPRLPEIYATSNDEISLSIDPSDSLHTLSPETANTSVGKLGGASSPCNTDWSPTSPASVSIVPGHQTQQQHWGTPGSISGHGAGNVYYHDSRSGYRGE